MGFLYIVRVRFFLHVPLLVFDDFEAVDLLSSASVFAVASKGSDARNGCVAFVVTVDKLEGLYAGREPKEVVELAVSGAGVPTGTEETESRSEYVFRFIGSGRLADLGDVVLSVSVGLGCGFSDFDDIGRQISTTCAFPAGVSDTIMAICSIDSRLDALEVGLLASPSVREEPKSTSESS